MPPKKIKEIYDAFNLRYDVRTARKFLGLTNSVTKSSVNLQLRNYYNEIEEDIDTDTIYQFVIKGVSRREEWIEDIDGSEVKVNPKKVLPKHIKLSKPKPIDLTFQSKNVYNILPVNVVGLNSDALANMGIKSNKGLRHRLKNDYPIVSESEANDLLANKEIVKAWMDKGEGSHHYKINTVLSVQRRKLPKKKALDLDKMLLYHSSFNLPYKAFNGFKDSGNMMCVPEMLLHHLKLNGRNKKLKLEAVIKVLDNDETGVYEEESANDGVEDSDEEFEKQELGKQGYNALDIIRALEHFNCRGRLLDITERIFATTDYKLKDDKKLFVFCGMVFDNHLYYCNDPDYNKYISGKSLANQESSGFSQDIYEKTAKKKEDTKQYYILPTNDLMSVYKERFAEDNTVRKVKTENGRITRITYGDKEWCANPDVEIMRRILGENFRNENLTMMGEIEFKEFYPSHKKSTFTKHTFDTLEGSKHGNIVETFCKPENKIQFEYDINKCRTACWLENKLGAWEIFGVESQVEDYNQKDANALKKGIYYVELVSAKDKEFFVRGNVWYSGDFVMVGLKEGFRVEIKYQLLATETLPEDYFKPFVEHIIKKYPDQKDVSHFIEFENNRGEFEVKHYYKDVCVFKKLINTCIGYRGKTRSESRIGYIEANFHMAVNAYWDNTDEKIGFLSDENVDKKTWKAMKGKLCSIHEINVAEDVNHYIVERTDFKTLYENDMPIYNKVLENEFLRVYELKKKVGGRLIKIKTDAIVVEGKFNHIGCDDKIGGYKYTKLFMEDVKVSEKTAKEDLKLDLSMNWNIVEEKADYGFEKFEGSFLITGLAGFGKSWVAKQQAEFSEETTLRLAFTNVATENISDEDYPANTLNSYFGINCMTGKCSEKKLKNLRKVKCIIITEVFMTPSYIMGHLSKIKHQFPHIKFICEGDPEQTRPVGEEHINWLKTRLLFDLCDGNMVQLKYNKRSQETANYYKILEGKRLPDDRYGYRKPCAFNICRTNAMRVSINDLMMDKEQGLLIEKSKANKYSQDIWIDFDTPIMCVKNNKKLSLKNGKMYKIESYDETAIVMNDALFSHELFAEHFVVAFAMTNHKIQGLTIKENFNIYEWNKMTRREQYTAYSRCSAGENVKIVSKDMINWDLVKELDKFFKLNCCIYKWTSTKTNHIYVGHTKNFEKRKAEHLKSALTESNKLYTCMRETGIDSWSCEKIHEFYAADRLEAERVEQTFKDKLSATLNMVECAVY